MRDTLCDTPAKVSMQGILASTIIMVTINAWEGHLFTPLTLCHHITNAVIRVGIHFADCVPWALFIFSHILSTLPTYNIELSQPFSQLISPVQLTVMPLVPRLLPA